MSHLPRPQDAPPEVGGVFLTEPAIRARVAELGARIADDYRQREIVLVTVLRGGVFFLADLCRAIDGPLRLDFIAITPYTEARAGGVRITKDLDEDIEGKHVLIVEDIIDTGLTLNYLVGVLRARGPASLEIAVLLDRDQRRIADLPIAYRGFQMPDTFVVGYGLDLSGRLRNLPYVGTLSEDVLEGLGLG